MRISAFALSLMLLLERGFALEVTQTAKAFENFKVMHLDLGEDYLIEIKKWTPHSKIWVENKKVLIVNPKQKTLILKSRQVGSSYVRIGHFLRLVRVSAVGSKNTFQIWQHQQNADLQKKLRLEYCEHRLCLKGAIHSLSELRQLQTFLKSALVPVQLSVETPSELHREIKAHLQQQVRELGLLHHQIFIEHGTWKLFVRSELPLTNDIQAGLKNIGLQVQVSPQIIRLQDSVAVSVKIVEINKSLVRKIGVTWPDQYSAQVVLPSHLAGENSFEVFLSAAENTGQAKVLSAPQLIGRSGEEATFFAGGEFPVKIHGARSYQVVWKKYGISLKLKPSVDALGQLSLKIDTEVSSVDRSLEVDDLPAISASRVSSQFDTVHMRTIALSGLIKNEEASNTSGLPFLKNIPLIGALFRSQDFIKNKTELVVFVTPKIIKPADEAVHDVNR